MPPSKVAARVSAVAFGVGLGVAITAGAGVAAADDSTTSTGPSKSVADSSTHTHGSSASAKGQPGPSSTPRRTHTADTVGAVPALAPASNGLASDAKSRSSRPTTRLSPVRVSATTKPAANLDDTVTGAANSPVAAPPSTILKVKTPTTGQPSITSALPAVVRTSALTPLRPHPVFGFQDHSLQQVVVHAVATWLKPLVDNAPAPTPSTPIYAALLNFARRIVEDGGYGTQAGYSFKMVNNTSHTLVLVSLTDRKDSCNPSRQSATPSPPDRP